MFKIVRNVWLTASRMCAPSPLTKVLHVKYVCMYQCYKYDAQVDKKNRKKSFKK